MTTWSPARAIKKLQRSTSANTRMKPATIERFRRFLGRLLCIALVIVFASSTAIAATASAPSPHSVLWIGNSFNYYNGGLPKMFQALVAELRLSLRIGMEAVGRAHLPAHATNPDLPLGNAWDLVVVQGYSDEPTHPSKAEAFRNALDVLNNRITLAGSETALFMTWAYKNRPEMTQLLAGAYQAAGQDIGAQVIPVGLAFAAARQARPALRLYVAEDDKHPSPAGT